MASPQLWELHIEKDRDKYRYLVDDPGSGTISYRGALTVPSDVRSEVLDTFDDLLAVLGEVRGEPSMRADEAFAEAGATPEEMGRLIYKYMIPSECRSRIQSIDSEFVKISTDDVEVPWELLFDGTDFFSIKNAVGRTIQANTAVAGSDRPTRKQDRVLLVGNPTCDLEGASREVSVLADVFGSMSNVAVDVLEGADATFRNLVFEHLEEHFYDIIHYAGHTSFDESRPDQSEIHLNDGGVTAQYLMNILDPPPRLVFMNSCSSSTSTGLEYWEREGKVTGLATSFLSSGVDHYVGALWPVSDEVSRELAAGFYRRIAEGDPIGVALQGGKEDAVATYADSLSPSAFILYGDPRTVFSSGADAAKRELLQETSYQSSRRLCADIGVGRVDAGFLGLNQVLVRLEQGLPVKVVGVSSYSSGGVGIIANPTAGIESVGDLEGAVVGVAPNMESTSLRWFHGVLDSADVDPHDVTMIDLGGSDHYRYLEDDRLDATVTWDPWKTLAESVGTLVTDDSYADERSYEVIVANTDLIERRESHLREMLNTHFHVIERIEELEEYPPTYLNRLGINAMDSGLSDDGYARPGREKHFGPDLEADLKRTIEVELEYLQDRHFVPGTSRIDVEDVVDLSFVPEASEPKSIRTSELSIGHNDSLACIVGIEDDLYV